MNFLSKTVSVWICLVMSSCYSVGSYNGDGYMTDSGYQLKGGRYSVNLGEISLSNPVKHVFTFSNLPSNYTFTAGIHFESDIETIENIETKIRISLFSGQNQLFS